MNMITQYLNALENNLPDDLKQEVREELEASIYGQVEDQQEALGRELNSAEIETILLGIGHPIRVASSYQTDQQLISSEYFPAFKKALEITLLIVLGIKLIIFAPALLSSESLIASLIGVIWSLFDSALWVFAVVTLIFYSMQKNSVDLQQIYAWSPKNLKYVSRKISINRVETVFEVIMTLIFIGWWNNLFNWPDINFSNDVSATAIFSLEWNTVTAFVNIIMGLSIAVSLHKIIVAGWSKLTLIADILLNIASLIVITQIASFDNFVIISSQAAELADTDKFINVLNMTTYSVLGFIGLFLIWDSYSCYRKLRLC